MNRNQFITVPREPTDAMIQAALNCQEADPVDGPESEMFHQLIAANSAGAAQISDTPSARWHYEGKPDPHGTRYNCERKDLLHGDLTDDEVANEVYLYDHRRGLESMAWLTTAKDRIRWLSRQVETLRQANTAKVESIWLATHPEITDRDERGKARVLTSQDHLASYIDAGWQIRPYTVTPKPTLTTEDAETMYLGLLWRHAAATQRGDDAGQEKWADKADMMHKWHLEQEYKDGARWLARCVAKWPGEQSAAPEWISIETGLPSDGQPIEGRNKGGGTWQETFDSDEPLGSMVEWRPMNFDALENERAITAQLSADNMSLLQELDAAKAAKAWMAATAKSLDVDDPDGGVFWLARNLTEWIDNARRQEPSVEVPTVDWERIAGDYRGALLVGISKEVMLEAELKALREAQPVGDAYLQHELKSIYQAVTALGVVLHYRDDGSFARAELPKSAALPTQEQLNTRRLEWLISHMTEADLNKLFGTGYRMIFTAGDVRTLIDRQLAGDTK